MTFAYFGGKPGDLDLASIAKPLVASALAYYLVNTLIVATAVGLAARQPVWHVWQTNFLWTAPSYFVGAGAAVAGVALWETSQWWLLPLAGRAGVSDLPVVSHVCGPDRIGKAPQGRGAASARRHGRRTRSGAPFRAALCAGGRRFATTGLWDWDIPANSLYCSDRWKLIVGLDADDAVSTHEQWLNYTHEEDRPGAGRSASRASRWRARAFRARVPRAPGAWRDPLGAVPRHRGPR